MIKTAGTTIHYVFRQNYGINFVEISKDRYTFNSKDLGVLLKWNPRIKAIARHSLGPDLCLGTAQSYIRYVTFFRDPIYRFLSHYNHSKEAGYFNGSLEEYCRIPENKDYQTKFIMGHRNDRGFVASDKHLERAKEILQKDYHFVGIVEDFDRSLLAMQQLLNLDDFDPRYEVKKDKVPGHSAKNSPLRSLNRCTRLTLWTRSYIDLSMMRFIRPN